jgi:PAS domain S-box-containing protein
MELANEPPARAGSPRPVPSVAETDAASARTRPIQLLHFEANPADTALLQRVLAAEHVVAEVLRVDTEEDLVTTLKECRFDLVVAQPGSAGTRGPELLQRIASISPDLPVIFFIADLAPDVARECIAAGAGAVVFKSSPARLATAVQEAIAFARFRADGGFQPLTLTAEEIALRDAAAAAGQGFWLMAVDTAEVIWSTPNLVELFPAAQTAAGRTDRHWLNWIHPGDREPIAQLLDVHLREGEVEVELQPVPGAADNEPLIARLHPVRDAEGRVVRVAATAGRRARMLPPPEATPANADQAVAAALLALPDLCFVMDAEGIITTVHAGDPDDLLLHPERLLGRFIGAVGRREVARQFHDALQRVRQTGATVTFEYPITRAGATRYYEARLLPLPEGRLCAVIRNITARRESEATLRESQQRISTLMDSLPGIVFSGFDHSEATLNYLSEGVSRLTGYRREELLREGGSGFRQLIHPDDWPPALAIIREAGRRHTDYIVEYRIRTKNGTERWLWEKGRSLYNPQGEPCGCEGFIIDITDRKQADQALRQQSELLRGAALAAQHLLTEGDPATALQQALATIGHATGADRVYLYGYPSGSDHAAALAPHAHWHRASTLPALGRALWPGKTLAALGLERWETELQAGRTISGPARRLPAGEFRALAADDVRSVLILPILCEGELLGFLGLDDCTTEREWSATELSVLTMTAASVGGLLRIQRDKHSLDAAESKYRDLVENAADGIYRCAPDGRFLSANPAAARIFGSPSPAHLLAHHNKFDPARYPDAATLAEFRRRLQETGRVERFEYRLRQPDGTTLWILENARAVRDAAGQLTCFEGTLVDVTARKQMEQALRESEMLYHSLVDNVPVYLFRKDLQGRITYLNKRTIELMQRPAEAVLGRTDHDLFPPENARVYVQADRTVIQTGQPLEMEEEFTTASGRRLSVHTIKTPLRDAEGNIIGVQGVFWDITERKETEAQLCESKRHLETTLEELRRTQQQIVQQERLSAVGQMASGIAHDFNNTLMAILGFTELLLMHPEALDQRDKVITYLKTMNRAAKDAAGVVKRLNDFYRHRDESQILPPVDVRKLVEQIIPLTQPKWKDQALANGAQIQVVTDLQDVLPVPANESELRECLMNLIFNAVDALPQGGTLTLATRMDGDAVLIEVADTGTGMTEEVRKRCFEPFFSTKGQRGTGLGLAMVFGTIQRHQGTIELQSELGKGTRLLIRLPALKNPGVRGGDTEILAAPTRPLNVLVVDDEPLIRQILTEYLQADGHTVATAGDGREALRLFGEARFDLVLTDRSMPQMSGDQLADAIKKVDPTRPVVLLTGFGDMMKATGQKPPGIDVIMSKPITLNGLRLSLAEAVRSN